MRPQTTGVGLFLVALAICVALILSHRAAPRYTEVQGRVYAKLDSVRGPVDPVTPLMIRLGNQRESHFNIQPSLERSCHNQVLTGGSPMLMSKVSGSHTAGSALSMYAVE